ncbi:MAG: DUF362 domain-containing protein [Chloroflexota bacterium]
MAKSVVSIVKGTDAEKMVEEALSLIGGVGSLIKQGSVVVIKPNSIGNRPPERATSTSPAMISAVIKVLRKAQPKEIIMTENVVPADTLEGFEVNGHKKAAEDAGVDRIINITGYKDLIKIPLRNPKGDTDNIFLPRFLVEADHLVNVPIFKTHISMMYTAAMKNLFGLLIRDDKTRMHLNFPKNGQAGCALGLMDLWSASRADLSIVDMTRVTEGYGPLGGIPTDFGCVVAGKDPIAVDSTCCRMTGLDITKTPYFQAILDCNLGKHKEEDIEVRGRKVKEVFKKLWTPYLDDIVKKYPEYRFYKHEGACFLCEGLIAWSLERIKPLGEYEKNAGMSIVYGRAKELPKGVKPQDLILLGNCIPKKFRDKGIWVQACPPIEREPASAIIDRRYDGWGTPTVNKRNYRQEIDDFIDYEKELRAGVKL